jgi:hypothetical protein
MRTTTTWLAIVLMFVGQGCSLANSGQTNVTLMASHPGADIYVDGNLVGKSPQQISLNSGNEHSVMAKCGDSAGTGRLDRKLSGTGIADIIGGLLILVPFVGLASDGAYTLEPKTLTVAIPDSSGCDGSGQ